MENTQLSATPIFKKVKIWLKHYWGEAAPEYFEVSMENFKSDASVYLIEMPESSIEVPKSSVYKIVYYK